MKKRTKFFCFMLSALMIVMSSVTVFAADSEESSLSATIATAEKVSGMVSISAPYPFEFIVSTTNGNTAFISFVPDVDTEYTFYLGVKGQRQEIFKINRTQYMVEAGVEYSFAYSYTVGDDMIIYNGTLLVTADDAGITVTPTGVVRNITYAGDITEAVKTSYFAANSRAAGTVNESESNNTMATADVTYDDYDSFGTLGSSSDVDWWKVSFAISGTANFWLGNIPNGCNYDISVYSQAGMLLGESYNSGATAELVQIDVTAGTYYYIKVDSAASSSSSQYLLRVKWYASIQDNKVYYIKSMVNNHCITVENGWNANSMNIFTSAFNSDPSDEGTYRNYQRFRLIYNESGNYYNIAPVCSFDGFSSYNEGRVIDVNSTNGIINYANVMTWWNNGANEEKFSIVAVEPGVYAIKLRYNSTFALERQSNGNVCINTYTGSNAQLWEIQEDTDYNAAEEYYLSLDWAWPISFNHLSSSYGYRNYNGNKFHNGIDVPTGINGGYPVYAAQSGTVHNYGYDDAHGCGFFLIVKTNNSVYPGDPNYSNKKLCYLYQHLETYPYITNVNLKIAGYQIQKGEQVAKSGNSGMIEGNYHLHYTVITSESVVFYKPGYDPAIHFHDTFNPLAFYDTTSLVFDFYD